MTITTMHELHKGVYFRNSMRGIPWNFSLH